MTTQTFEVPAHVTENIARRQKAHRVGDCGEGVGAGQTCGAAPAVLFPRGWRCRFHRPDAVSAVAPFPHPEPCEALSVDEDSLGRPIRRLPTACKIARSVFVNARGCWVNTTGQNDLGYAAFDGQLAHRFIYEILIGPVPDGLELDHLCRNPPCCNPAHLEPVTHRENLRRGVAARLGDRCARGHDGPWYERGDGQRDCRRCRHETRPKQRVVPCTCSNGRCADCRAARRAADAKHEQTLTEQFIEFHAKNGHVMERLEELIAEHVTAGAQRLGMGALFEQLRGQVETNGRRWQLDNSLRADYARALTAAHPEWAHLFETRQRRSA